jgi:hypothetical protein
MNWPLFWALALAFGVIVGNIMLIKHSAKIKMPSLKDLSEPFPKHPEDGKNNKVSDETAAEITPPAARKPNSPE